MKLNNKLFELQPNDVYKLKSDVREALINIASAFCNFLSDNGITITPADIQFVGSNAGEDYTDASDIDLHIVADFESISCDSGIIQAAFNAQRSLFNSTYDITVKGIPVELYVEDVKAGTESNGIYSVLYDKWIKYPESQEPIPESALAEYDKLLDSWIQIINNACKLENLSEIQRVLNRLYMMRKNGLATSGRNSAGNYIFKQLRNKGYLKQIKDLRDELISQTLTLESILHKMTESVPAQNFQDSATKNTIKYEIDAKINVDEGKLRGAKQSLEMAATRYSNLHPDTAVSIKSVSKSNLVIQITLSDEVKFDKSHALRIIEDLIMNSKFVGKSYND